jgi:hypothetical protein
MKKPLRGAVKSAMARTLQRERPLWTQADLGPPAEGRDYRQLGRKRKPLIEAPTALLK